jgi:phenylacetate-coenzyme A ligase PaaK-like adenylate-forming protein
MKLLIMSDFNPSVTIKIGENLSNLLKNSDFILFNLEGSPNFASFNNKKNQILKFDVEAFYNFLYKYGVNNFIVSIANNHILDNGIGNFKRFFHGYLSSIYLFAKLLESKNIEGNVFNLKGIMLGSENIDEEKRRFVEQYFNTKTYSWYGHTEKGILAGECEINRSYHSFFQYGFFDLLNENGFWTSSGEVITTGFVNKAMPLINYKTGDYAITDKSKCECGRNYTLIKKVIGRWGNDFVYDKNQNKVSTTALNIHIENQKDILNLQIIQKHLGEVEIAFSLIKIDNKKQIEEAKNYKFRC